MAYSDDWKLNFFNRIKEARNKYKKNYDNAKSEKIKSEKELNDNFKIGSKLWKEKKQAIPEAFNKAVADAKNKAMDDFITVITSEENRAKQSVTGFTNNKKTGELARVLHDLDALTLSKNEFDVLVQTYSGDYWCNRLLQNYGEKIGVLSIPIEPSLDARLKVLDDLSAECDKFLRVYGDDSLQSVATLHDTALQKLENRFTNAYSGLVLSTEKQAEIAVSKIYSASDELEKATVLNNVLQTSSDSVKDAVIETLATDNKLSDVCLKLSGANKIIEKRKSNLSNNDGLSDSEKIVKQAYDELTPEQKELAKYMSFGQGVSMRSIEVARESDSETLKEAFEKGVQHKKQEVVNTTRIFPEAEKNNDD